ncbi:MAG TPA: hypothetical protein ENI70_01095 [Candidatus Peregrinibacteria bacterium]|nr:hypothetical protein [Candidatus Peregrinibacteria bacterium]
MVDLDSKKRTKIMQRLRALASECQSQKKESDDVPTFKDDEGNIWLCLGSKLYHKKVIALHPFKYGVPPSLDPKIDFSVILFGRQPFLSGFDVSKGTYKDQGAIACVTEYDKVDYDKVREALPHFQHLLPQWNILIKGETPEQIKDFYWKIMHGEISPTEKAKS